jgi:hypothetical protein
MDGGQVPGLRGQGVAGFIMWLRERGIICVRCGGGQVLGYAVRALSGSSFVYASEELSA